MTSKKRILEVYLSLPRDLTSLSRPVILDLIAAVELSKRKKLEQEFCLFAEKSPDAILETSVYLLDRCLQKCQNQNSLATILIQYSPVHRLHFADFCCTADGRKVIVQHCSGFIPVVHMYLSLLQAQKKKKKPEKKAKDVLLTVMWPHLMGIMSRESTEDLLKEKANMLLGVLCKSIKTSQIEEGIRGVIDLQTGEFKSCQLKMVHTLFEELSRRKDCSKLSEIRILVIGGILQKSSSCETEDETILNYSVLESILEKAESIALSVVFATIWKKFVKNRLKVKYQDPRFQKLLGQLIKNVYNDASKKVKGLLTIEKLLQMVMSHSLFLPTMLQHQKEENVELIQTKGHLVSSLLFLFMRAPSCCQTSHLVVLLGAYGATRGTTDRHLLEILALYEKSDVALWDYRPYMWGQAAVAQHAGRKNLGRSLWTQPTMKEVLELLDGNKLYKSAINFPINDPLTGLISVTNSSSEMNDLYDPSFLLLLFGHLLATENVVDCMMFVQCNGLLLTICALSSHYEDVREAAYYVLEQYMQHLEGQRFRGRREIAFLLQCLKNSVVSRNARLPPVISLFMGKATGIMLSPSKSIFKDILQYVTLQPQLKTNIIPAFKLLFFSSDSKQKEERKWILNLLQEGLRDYSDYNIYVKNNIWTVLLSFVSSPHCTTIYKELILCTLQKGVAIPEAALSLVGEHSLLSWLLTVKADKEKEQIHTVTILETVQKSILGMWTKEESPELKLIVVKMSQEILTSCLHRMEHMGHVASELMNRILGMIEKSIGQLVKVNSGPVISLKVLTDIIELYQTASLDPVFHNSAASDENLKLENKPLSACVFHVRESPESETKLWLTNNQNKVMSDTLLKIFYYWLNNFGNRDLTNNSTSQSSFSGVYGHKASDIFDNVTKWCLIHYVRCDGQITSLTMSKLLTSVFLVIKADRFIGMRFAEGGKSGLTIKCLLSVYHVLSKYQVTTSCSEWLEERIHLLEILNNILFELSQFVDKTTIFQMCFDGLQSMDKTGQLSGKSEWISILMREFWSGCNKPSHYLQLTSGVETADETKTNDTKRDEQPTRIITPSVLSLKRSHQSDKKNKNRKRSKLFSPD